jgi:DNA-binding transcriptional MerR regulator
MQKGLDIDFQKIVEEGNKLQTEFSELSNSIKEERYHLSDLNLKPRWLNHWKESGILLRERKKQEGYTFDLVESVWLKIVVKLREFKVSLETIKSLKEYLSLSIGNNLTDEQEEIMRKVVNELDGGKNKSLIDSLMRSPSFRKEMQSIEVSILEIMILDVLVLRNEFRLLINQDGVYIPFKETYRSMWEENEVVKEFMRRTHISLSINEAISELIDNIGIDEAVKVKVLTADEASVIEAMREDNVREVSVRYGKGGKPNLLLTEKWESIDKSARIQDLIMAHGYHDIKVKTENGTVVTCVNANKKKLN